MAQAMTSSRSNERSIHEMLKDSPSMNESSGAVQSGTAVPPGTLNLSSPTGSSGGSSSRPFSAATTPVQNGDALLKAGASKIDSLKTWSISTYKCTKQLMFEKLGKSSRTVDTELEAQIEQLRDTQRKYSNILRLTRALSAHFHNVVQTQHALGEAFSELAQKSPELQQEFLYNSETQRSLTRNGEILLGALNFFTSSVNTLCNKTIEDTLLTIRQYEVARIEYDAYRSDLEILVQSPTETSQAAAAGSRDEIQKSYQKHKENFEKLRDDVSIKLKFLDENRIKVMHKQLLLFHNAISAYFSGNAGALEATLKQFNVKVRSPNSSMSSWLENH